MRQLLFYTTVGCHLCEDAETILQGLVSDEGLQVEAIDIASEEALVTLYGIRIPVVKNVKTEEELGWPFSREDVLSLF